MKQLSVFLATLAVAASLAIIGCSQAAPPPPAPTAAPAAPAPKAPAPTAAPAAPTKAPEPTKPAAAPPAPTAAPAQPTAAPAKAVDFPTKGKAISILVGYAAGGNVDLAARAVAAGLEKELGTPVQVVNKPGASTMIAMTEMVNSKPDGYTLATLTFMTALITYLDPAMKATYSRKDFQPVANFFVDYNALSVKADSPYKTVKDFVDAAKANPEKVKAGTSGIMTNTHIPMLMLEQLTGARFAYVHFAGGMEPFTAMLGGNVDSYVSGGSTTVPLLKNGQVRALGIVDEQENQYMPGVKTLKSMGYDVVSPFAVGLVAPAGTPKDVASVLATATQKALARDDVKQQFVKLSASTLYLGPDQFADYWTQMETRVKPIVALAKERQK